MVAKRIEQFLKLNMAPLTETEKRYMMDYINLTHVAGVYGVKHQDIYDKIAKAYHVTPAAITYTIRQAIKKSFGENAQISNCLTIIVLLYEQYIGDNNYGEDKVRKYFI